MIETNKNPSKRDVRVFGLLFLLFFPGLGLVAMWKPGGLLGAASFLSLAWIISLLTNPLERRKQRLGFLMPLLLGLTGGAVRLGLTGGQVTVVAGSVGVLGAILIWARPDWGSRIYGSWMSAVEPIGWTISQLILGVVYYLVITPIGLIMRLGGYDPMKRRLDRSASMLRSKIDGEIARSGPKSLKGFPRPKMSSRLHGTNWKPVAGSL